MFNCETREPAPLSHWLCYCWVPRSVPDEGVCSFLAGAGVVLFSVVGDGVILGTGVAGVGAGVGVAGAGAGVV